MNLIITLILSVLISPQDIELTHFSAQEKDNKIYLKWAVIESSNIAYFKLESSTDDLNYKVIERVSASETNEYAVVDQYPRDGDMYYRLRLHSKDGQKFTSEAIHIETGKGKTVGIPTGAKWRSEDYNYE
jgi:hypothetical protein